MIKQKKIYDIFLKRLFDLTLSMLVLIGITPILLLTALLVKFKLGSPILFKQQRPGKKERIFTMYKFRTMTDNRNTNGLLLDDKYRVTRFGRLLRASSIDELPELFNILKGDMSFVGPRPQLVKDLVFMNCDQRKRHNVLPGLTGLAQINGRNAIGWEEKLEFDINYIENISFMGDIIIIIKTFFKVIKRSNITYDKLETSMDFGDYLLSKGAITIEEFEKKINSFADEYKVDEYE